MMPEQVIARSIELHKIPALKSALDLLADLEEEGFVVHNFGEDPSTEIFEDRLREVGAELTLTRTALSVLLGTLPKEAEDIGAWGKMLGYDDAKLSGFKHAKRGAQSVLDGTWTPSV